MLRFLSKTLVFILILMVLLLTGLFLPVTPRASRSLLLSNTLKDSLMRTVDKPRIIFIGGSNLSFGLNSQLIKDSLGLNPINTGIHAAIGLIYMMDNALQYVKEGDIIILIPEYEQFYDNFSYGSEELLRTIFDVNPDNVKLLRPRQIIRIIPYLPNYTMSKFRLREYINTKDVKYYSVNSFNKYGDVYTHWGEKREVFQPAKPLNGKYNKYVAEEIKRFQLEIEKKNANLFLSFEGLQDISYSNSREQIKKIETEFKINGFNIIGIPERYIIPDSLTFNTPSHLTKVGVDYRTRVFIEDFRALKN